MKRLWLKRIGALAAFASLATASLLHATPAMAGTATANLTVSASVSANCTISTSELAFGAYDPVTANKTTALDGTGGVSVTCTSGSPIAITLGQGLNFFTGSSDSTPLRQMSNGTDALRYDLFSDSSHAVVWGNTPATALSTNGTGSAQALTVYGDIPPGQNVPAGSYGDTVVATVSF